MINKVTQQNPYGVITEGYGAFNTSSKVRGTLIEKNANDVKIDIGDNKIMQATLKDKIDAQVGDIVVIDKREIVKSKTTIASDVVIVQKDEQAQYEEILNRLDVPITKENIKVAKTLEIHDIQITKENIQSFVFSKNCLEDIVGNLDYDSAIKLLEKDIDLENDSLQKIAVALEEVKHEEEGFAFSKLFKKKEINTEEAEEIAEKIYGSKMGKDITDIIKALYKRGVSITKKNVEKVNDVFYKLDKLQAVENQTLIDTVKNKVEASIDNLYKLKNFVKKGAIEAVDKISAWTTKAYESFTPKVSKITEKDLQRLEEDIKSLLRNMDIKDTDENIKLSKDFIKNNIEVTKENIESIQEMKEALKVLIQNLDYDKAAALIKSGVNIEKEDIRKVANQLKEIENIQVDVNVQNKEVKDLLEKIKDFKKIEDKDLLTLLKKNVDFKINKIDQVIFKKNKDMVEEITATPYENMHLNLSKTKEEEELSEANIKAALEKIEIQVTKENIQIAKELTKQDIKITKENIESIQEMKQALDKVIKELEQGVKVDIENKDIRVLAKEIDEIKEQDNTVKGAIDNVTELKNIENKQPVSSLKEEMDFSINKLQEKLPQNKDRNKVQTKEIDFKVSEEEIKESSQNIQVQDTKENITAVQEMKKTVKEDMEELNKKQTSELTKAEVESENIEISNMVEKINILKKVEDKDLVGMFKQELDFQIEKIEENQNTQTLNTSMGRINRLSQLFGTMKELDFNVVAFQMRNNIPITLRNLQSSYLWINKKTEKLELQNQIEKIEMPKEIGREQENGIQKYVKENKPRMQRGVEIAKALIQNSLSLSKSNIQRVYEAYGHYKNVRDHLSSNMVIESVEKGMHIENMDLKDVSDYVDNWAKNIGKGNEELKYFTHHITSMNKERESAIALLMKRNKPISLKEIQKNSFLLKNKDQVGHKIGDMIDFLEEREEEDNKEGAAVLKSVSKDISKKLKEGNVNPEKAYEEIMNAVKEVKNNVKIQEEEGSKTFHKKYKELLDTLEQSHRLNKEEKMLQFPLYMNEQFTNLNMFFRDRQKGNKKMDAEDMSVVLSLETKNMGNVNIQLKVDKKQVKVEMGISKEEDKTYIEKYEGILNQLLEKVGYELGDISFDVKGKDNLMKIGENEVDKIYRNKGFLDLKI